ncbi:ABC transporter substrate-binding protein [Salinibacterium hongtaonis]|uniref:ABC transporter substrate-binding protein n=1 Tax=Homoserinimonas hongtaonis TaxID=2079791 RepID=A0A2U1T015_9MICO|nr:ABC transporter substrate-binding protein [Salinibacterium hongtaonis]AWB89755.1 hypothetical protein C2138_09600 [Salinibacterium hongtaonis]PWB97210.1 ABC transporter substrate-binding protein [Salinibacterium hongtaonis]
MKSAHSLAPRLTRRGFRWAVAIVATAALALTGCSAADDKPTEGAATGGTLTIGVGQDAGRLDPVWSNLPTYNQFAYATLVHQTAEGEFTPYLATSWTFGDDAKSITLELRDDAKYSDGTDVTAENVVASINRFLATPGFKVATYGSQIAGAEATGELEVTVRFKIAVPQAYALGTLNDSSVVSMVTSEAGTANPELLDTTTLGAGPYVLDQEQTVIGIEYTYVKNEHYFAPETVTYDTIVIMPFADPNALANAVTTGQVSYALEVLAPLAAAAENSGLRISKGALGVGASGTSMLVFGEHETGPTADVRVRQAIAYAIDRASINEALYAGLATPTSSATPKGADGHTGEDPYAYNPDTAKKLLAEAGYPDGFDITITDPSAFDPGNLVGQAVQGALEAIGINVTLERNNDPFTDLTAKLSGGQFEAYIYSEFGESAFNLVTGSMQSVGGALNPNGYAIPDDITTALEAVSAAPADKQGDLLKELTRAVDANQWFVTITSIPRFTVAQPGITGVPADYVTAEPTPYSPVAGASWSGN